MLISNWISIFFFSDSVNFFRELREMGYLLDNQFVVLEKTLESPLDCKEIKAVNLKGNESWIFIGMADAEAEVPILCPRYTKNWLIGKTEGRRRRRIEDEVVGWRHQLHGYEFEQAPGVGHGQGSLACCSPWDCRVEHDWVTKLNYISLFYKII